MSDHICSWLQDQKYPSSIGQTLRENQIFTTGDFGKFDISELWAMSDKIKMEFADHLQQVQFEHDIASLSSKYINTKILSSLAIHIHLISKCK